MGKEERITEQMKDCVWKRKQERNISEKMKKKYERMLEREEREKGKFQDMHEEGGKRDTLTEGVDILAMALKEG